MLLALTVNHKCNDRVGKTKRSDKLSVDAKRYLHKPNNNFEFAATNSPCTNSVVPNSV